MGLLDEAIREHLELKRRRGADPAEVERAEREALGPVRRGPEPVSEEPELAFTEEADPFVSDESELSAPQFEGAPAPVEEWADEPDWDEPAEEHPPVAFESPPATPEAPAVPEPPAHPDPPATATPEPHPAPGPPASGDETVEYHVEEALASERDEDVLEETPEFLQDTPDHDRLWFEQRPPRDFDFDK